MHARSLPLWALLTACPSDPPPPVDPVDPVAASIERADLDCMDRWQRPAELMGPEGFGHHGWTDKELEGFGASWGLPTHFRTNWISDASKPGAPSARVHVLRAPDVSACSVDGLRAAMASTTPLADAVAHQSAFVDRAPHIDALQSVSTTSPHASLDDGNPLYRAILGILQHENPGSGAPSADAAPDDLQAVCDRWPAESQRALAELILAAGASHAHRERALGDADRDAVQRVHDQFQAESYATLNLAFEHPRSGTIEEDLRAVAEEVDTVALTAGAHQLATAAEQALNALSVVEPFDGGDLELDTAHGRIVLRSGASDDTWTGLDDALLVVDLGGDDDWQGQYASTTELWQAASVVLDVRGNDTYGTATPDLQAPDTTAGAGFDVSHGFTQGAGLIGYGMLLDGSGDDTYAASVHGQGSGVLGVGLLSDRSGADTYRLGAVGQGAAMFGLGVLHDHEGDDELRLFSLGQGMGKAGGHGLLLDGGGSDLTVAYVAEQEPWLPAEHSMRNLLAYPGNWAYGIDGTPHYMSVAQGTGWGYRADWMSDRTNWGGGFGALVDFGDGADTRIADCMSMGQGFIYGMGMLYDDGGDDTYRNFWWGMGASAHMGVGLLWDKDGNDDHTTTRASSAFGYDYGVGWFIDDGGDDTYRGQVHYGRGYQNGFTFFLNTGGDDTYNAERMKGNNVWFGVVRNNDGGRRTLRLAGVFMDLGGGNDVYNTDVEGPANDATWYHEPVGKENNISPRMHKGIGIDK